MLGLSAASVLSVSCPKPLHMARPAWVPQRALLFSAPFSPQWLARPHRASNHRRPRCDGGAFNIFLAVFGAIYALNWFRRLLAPSPGLGWEAAGTIAAILAFLFVLTVAPALLDPVFETAVVFQKPQSESYATRMMWNQMGMDAFFATHGLGVGLGSARSSNWYVAILSNTGVIGGALLASFIARVFLQRGPSEPRAAELVAALKLSLLPGFVMAGLTGLSPDFGVANGATFGLITSLASATRLPLSKSVSLAPAADVKANSTSPGNY
jgi:hypothetical protein